MSTSNDDVDPVVRLDGSTIPSGDVSDGELVELADLAASVAGDHDEELRQAAEMVRARPEGTAVFWLGQLLVQRGAPRLGAHLLLAILEHAELSDRDVGLAVLAEVIDALDQADEPTIARRSFESSRTLGWDAEAVLRYRYAFAAMCSGDLAPAAEVIATLPADGEDAWTRSRLADILDRAERLDATGGLDLSELRCWHFVAYGSLLMRRFEVDGQAENGGRFGWLQLDEHDVVRDLDLAVEALQIASGAAITSVAGASDMESQVLASVASQRHQLRWVDVGDIAVSDGQTLVVGGSSGAVAELRNPRLLGDRTWWYAATLAWNHWSVSSDAIGVAAEFVNWPWESRLAVGDDGPVTHDPDVRSAAELGEALASLTVEPSPDQLLVLPSGRAPSRLTRSPGGRVGPLVPLPQPRPGALQRLQPVPGNGLTRSARPHS